MTSIVFRATVSKVQTLTDNGIRVALDLSENDTMNMAQLAECQRFGVVLVVSATPDRETVNITGEEQVGENGKARNLEARTKRQSTWRT